MLYLDLEHIYERRFSVFGPLGRIYLENSKSDNKVKQFFSKRGAKKL
jgi:hypothetical protein